MTHVSNYAQMRSLGSAAFARKNNEICRRPTDRREVISQIFEFFLIALAKFVQIVNRKTIISIGVSDLGRVGFAMHYWLPLSNSSMLDCIRFERAELTVTGAKRKGKAQ